MTPPEPASPLLPRWLWLDRWFAPRWRALLTWIVLVSVTAAILRHSGSDWIRAMVNWWTSLINPVLPAPIPVYLAVTTNYLLLLAWFEPFALRLNPARGIAWLGVRVLQVAVCSLVFQSRQTHLAYCLILLFESAKIPVLLGWRTRPWMPVVCGALILGHIFMRRYVHYRYAYDLWPVVESLTYAIPLLYGTRLLRPEERARPT